MDVSRTNTRAGVARQVDHPEPVFVAGASTNTTKPAPHPDALFRRKPKLPAGVVPVAQSEELSYSFLRSLGKENPREIQKAADSIRTWQHRNGRSHPVFNNRHERPDPRPLRLSGTGDVTTALSEIAGLQDEDLAIRLFTQLKPPGGNYPPLNYPVGRSPVDIARARGHNRLVAAMSPPPAYAVAPPPYGAPPPAYGAALPS